MELELKIASLGSTKRNDYDQFSYGVSDRGASVRIPWQVARDGKGYLEDRRPNANADPYVVATLITNTCLRRTGLKLKLKFSGRARAVPSEYFSPPTLQCF